MNAKPSFPRRSPLSITVPAALATLIAVGIFTAIAFLFQRDGRPFEQLAAAEHACTQHVYVSEREACIREWLAAARASTVASKKRLERPGTYQSRATAAGDACQRNLLRFTSIAGSPESGVGADRGDCYPEISIAEASDWLWAACRH